MVSIHFTCQMEQKNWPIHEAALLLAANSEGTDMEIRILGPGCAKCKKAEKVVREAVAETSVDADVKKVEDVMEIVLARLPLWLTEKLNAWERSPKKMRS